LIGKGRTVYTFFKNTNKTITSIQSKTIIDDIFNYYQDYNFIINPIEHNHEINDINQIMEHINATRMEGSYTFLLSILKAFKENQIKQNEVIDLFHETLVLMVRRKYGELRTTKYDVIFPGMLKYLLGETNIVQKFQNIIRKEEYWVSDEEFSNWIIERPLYRSKDLPFTNLILREVDKEMESYGQYPDFTTLNTIEHIIPQTLNKEWEDYLGNESFNADLKRYIDTIGNVTLLSQPANSHVGQDPFISKIGDYSQVTALNRDIITRKDQHWGIEAIKKRSNYLKEKLLKIYSWKM
jgi:hypothetical protein